VGKRGLDVERMAKRFFVKLDAQSRRVSMLNENDLANFARTVARSVWRIVKRGEPAPPYCVHTSQHIAYEQGWHDAADAIRRALRRRPHG